MIPLSAQIILLDSPFHIYNLLEKEKTILKELGHEIRIVLKWYGLIGLGYEKAGQSQLANF